jgi:hypothetical protein
MKLRSALGCVLSLTLLTGACSGDDAEATSTTTSSTTTAAPVTSLQAAESTTTSTVPPTSTTTTTTVDPFGEASFPEYTIVSRETGADGDTVVVLLDDDTGSLTDIDLQNVVIDVVERFPPILTAHIIADASAAEAVLATVPSEAEQELLDRYYYVRLEEGFRLVFTGQFSDTPTTVLGS